MTEDFLSKYLNYVGETEAPIIYHRWCALAMVGTYLGRSLHFKLGHFNINPNLYVMLMGPPGARKSTAIKIAKSVIEKAGYTKISADRSSKEKFLMDLAGEDMPADKDILDQNLWGDSSNDDAEVWIACDEFNDFIGINNVEFMSILGSFWDFNGTYTNRIKTGKSISITNPTVSVLGGNTITNFIRAFPPETLGQGFLSRLLIIHGEPTGKKITFPAPPADEATMEIVAALQAIKVSANGLATLDTDARSLLDKIYRNYKGIDDVRFESYSQRRFSHLLKLCLVIAACHYSSTVTKAHVIEANTILTYTEQFMPTALGEFGRSKNSDTTHIVMQVLNANNLPMQISDIWTKVSRDIAKVTDLGEILRNLMQAGRIITVHGGFLSKRAVRQELNSEALDYSYLTEEERKDM